MPPNRYTHLAALGATTIKTGPGTLHAITINSDGASANTLTAADATSGTSPAIAIINTVGTGPFTLIYDVQFGVGLTITLATGTSADVTICWR